jgi:hypothetical protein
VQVFDAKKCIVNSIPPRQQIKVTQVYDVKTLSIHNVEDLQSISKTFTLLPIMHDALFKTICPSQSQRQ